MRDSDGRLGADQTRERSVRPGIPGCSLGNRARLATTVTGDVMAVARAWTRHPRGERLLDLHRRPMRVTLAGSASELIPGPLSSPLIFSVAERALAFDVHHLVRVAQAFRPSPERPHAVAALSDAAYPGAARCHRQRRQLGRRAGFASVEAKSAGATIDEGRLARPNAWVWTCSLERPSGRWTRARGMAAPHRPPIAGRGL